MGCFENPEKICEDLRQCVTEFLILEKREENPERRETYRKRRDQETEKWTRAIAAKRTYEKQMGEAKKVMLKLLDEGDHERFLEWADKN